MDAKRKASLVGIVSGIVGTLAVLAIIGLVFVYSGAYNIAATEEHASATRWAFDTTFHRSIEARAGAVAAPETVSPEMIAAGAASYKQMCQHCHAGPGIERAGWAAGMRPQPPHLTEAAAEWQPQEIFWLVKHGAKMTGMPAFGPTHDDGAIWNIAAFVKELPAMTEERYAALGGEAGHHSGSTN